jgi:UDP-N-acetylglucosamine 2-epimerase (non-hydrolysing)
MRRLSRTSRRPHGWLRVVPYAPLVEKRLIVEIAAARPNFMKVAPIHRGLLNSSLLQPVLIHTGQHYDASLSDVFFSDLKLTEPDIRLGVGSGTHAAQTAGVLLALEPHLLSMQPAAVLVVGDVNSTLAAAVCAAKLQIPVVHVEAGLRSRRRDMPEEINRVVTDAISDLLLAPSEDAVENLLSEGHSPETVHMVGNVMIDSLDAAASLINASDVLSRLGLLPNGYFVATLHRPSNVDRPQDLEALLDLLRNAATIKPLVFVIHPRTLAVLQESDVVAELEASGVRVVEPLGYLDFVALVSASAAVLTDSGGLQEETTILGVPCLTLRDETERPITVTQGTNVVVGRDKGKTLEILSRLPRDRSAAQRPTRWDGHAAERIVRILEKEYA